MYPMESKVFSVKLIDLWSLNTFLFDDWSGIDSLREVLALKFLESVLPIFLIASLWASMNKSDWVRIESLANLLTVWVGYIYFSIRLLVYMSVCDWRAYSCWRDFFAEIWSEVWTNSFEENWFNIYVLNFESEDCYYMRIFDEPFTVG